MPLWPTLVALQTAAAPHLAATRAVEPPVIDGRLDDAAWQRAAASDAFTQKQPIEGKRPPERTVVRVLYDDAALYVGVACAQQSAPVVARLTRRDRQVEADSVTIGLDTRGDGKNAFEFSVNAAGVLSDGVWSNDTEFSRDWDEIWDARAAIDAAGWSAEIRIPLHALRYPARAVQSWGLQVRRYVSARQEVDEWAFSPKTRAGEVSLYGRLDGLVGLRDKNYLELLPFVTARLRHRDAALLDEDPGVEPSASAGLDLRWHVTPRLTLNATVNPDFAQVEADPAVLNLGTVETFFPEKRPFFLEGADTFKTPLQLVYTRRIGRAPDEPALLEEAPWGEVLREAPEPAPIYGAAKLVGDLGEGVSMGQLVAITGQQRLEARRLDGSTLLRVADPLTSYRVLRLRSDLGGGVDLGVLATAVNRLEPGGLYPLAPAAPGAPRRQRCPGGDEVPIGARCYHDAYAGGIDALWRSPDYSAEAQILGTVVEEGPPRTMRDGTVIRSGDASPAGEIVVRKHSGHWLWEVNYEAHGRKADYNDLGYMRRQNHQAAFAGVKYRTTEPWWTTLETETVLGYFDEETLDFLNLTRGAFLQSDWKFRSFWGVGAFVEYIAPRFDDREVGDGTALERSGIFGTGAIVRSDPRARVSGSFFNYSGFRANGVFVEGNAEIAFKALPQLDVSLSPSWLYTFGEPRYVGTEAGALLFGRQQAQSLGLTLRSTYTFSPRLTLEAYAQAFLASEAYEDFSAFPASASEEPVEIRQDDLGPPPPVIPATPGYTTGTLNANLVLRWEYRLGSTLYVVYTHGQSDTEIPAHDARWGLRLRVLRPRVASDVLQLKLSYWWG